ncbi:hypothetical protein [Verrucomicrobium sp. BvORR106]|uniref:hypothetical protein n=1 Tax=Verrucomicrobium sp. BvORR106 TaxID=1403819 RepID=UPI0005707124|nr:hypothetical protein [Verrucomicrobium sp. BvORR106]
MKVAIAAILFLMVLLHLPAFAGDLSPQDVEHGKRQVERMLADRPGMAVYRREKDNQAGYVGEGDAIYQWAVEAYAGKYVGERVFWVQGDTEGAEACHLGVSAFGLCGVLIRDSSGEGPGEFEHMWSSFFYEVMNMSFATEWTLAEKAALDRSCSADEFVKRCAKVEWRALGELVRLRDEVWLPWAGRAGVKSDARYWHLIGQEGFEVWFSGYTDRSGYPWQPFLEGYEGAGKASNEFKKRFDKIYARRSAAGGR